MIGVMVDRLQSDIIRTALGITSGSNPSGPSPTVASNVSDVSHHIDARLLPMFASYVASARAQSGSYSFNSNNDDILGAINKMKVRHPFFGSSDSSPEVKLLNDVTRTTLPLGANSRLSAQEQILQAMIVNSSEKDSRLEASQCDEGTATLPAKKRSSSLSSSNLSSTTKKKARRTESNVSGSYVTTLSVKLSDAERRESFPLPGCRKRKVAITSELSSLSKLWDDYEMICYNMDDTVADQQAFVKKLFVQSLHRSKMSHLKDRMKLP
jgi:hypothetical protein